MNANVTAARPPGFGALAFLGLLGTCFGIVTLDSGWRFTLDQFSDFRYFVKVRDGIRRRRN